MTSLREAIEQAPDTVPTAREHAALIADIETYGASCLDCGTAASAGQTDDYLDAIRNDCEPAPWTCDDCDGGHEPGTSDCPLEVA